MHFTEELLRAVSELEIRSRRNVAALLAGNYRSTFRGSGMQFKEFRPYESGDDIRHMSWQVTARTGHATVKVYEEERELNIILLVDVSGSSQFGFTKKRKIDMYAELIALIGLAAVKSGDNVGVLLFNDDICQFLPPRRTRGQVLAAISQMMDQPLTGKKSDLRPALHYIRKAIKTRSLIMVLSDFLLPDFSDEMKMLSKKHELILLHCYDDAERGMSLNGVYEICDPETGEFLLLDANSPETKKAMSVYHLNLSHRLETLSRQSKADYLTLSVEDDYLQRLVHFFRRRGPARL